MLYDSSNSMDRNIKKMRERQTLELIEDIADMQYHKTGDKWWLNLGVTVAKKLSRRIHENPNI